MRSSTGAHFIALDHVRALAAFMVFVWHFTHGGTGSPVPFSYVPGVFPLSVLDCGHTGVALFMALSGYLFAKLLDNKSIYYPAFLWNRVLRLLPLLLVVVMLFLARRWVGGEPVGPYILSVASGVVLPTIPNGGWSITAEFHFYVILPLLLWMLRKSRWLPVAIIVAALSFRWLIWFETGTVKTLAYWTIVGRIDQFVLGMLLFQFRGWVARRHVFAIAVLLAFTLFYRYFDLHGELARDVSDPSNSPFWIYLPTVEGLAYAIGIAWYDSSFSPSRTGVSRFIGRIGEYSYSIYLLHFFIVFRASRFIHTHVMNISNFYLACLWALGFFLLMVPIGHLSFRFIEGPFLKLRKRYVVAPPEPRPIVAAATAGDQGTGSAEP